MDEHEDDLEVGQAATRAAESDAAVVATAVASGLREIATALQRGLEQVAAAIASGEPKRRATHGR